MNVPTVSSDGLNGLTPSAGTRSNVGLAPTTPQKDAGRTIDPAVWVPSASGTVPAPTAAAEPDDDPPGVRDGSWGLVVGPGWNPANSVVTVLPSTTAPASRSRATQVASALGWLPA